MKGVIIKAIAGFYYVEVGNTVYECRSRGNFRNSGISPLVGDIVEFEVANSKGVIEKVYDRKNYLIRPALANIDKLFIVQSFVNPSVNLYLTDRIIAICEEKNIEPILIFNKTDLGDFGEVVDIYRNIGYKSICSSCVNEEGIDKIKNLLNGGLSVFTGNSGVGKSSILNKILPDRQLQTGAVSEKLGRGRHTTRHIELFKFNNSYIADTPGFSALDLQDYEITDKSNLQYCFKEFDDCLGNCKFTSCTHTTEKGCAVLDAVSNSLIAISRHDSYVKLYNELKTIKSWEIKKK